ncbi:MAG: DUF3050 domain-containing protein [Hyphomicrobiaceae bacterium]
MAGTNAARKKSRLGATAGPPAEAAGGPNLIADRIAPLKAQLAAHPVYATLGSVEDVRIFMQHHVFAVWDFMSLLKALQRDLTCVSVPWKPTGSPSTRRFVNAIVLEEESDEANGRPASHYELYLDAMREIGADTGPIEGFVKTIENIDNLPAALARSDVPLAARDFVRTTFDFIATGKPHVIAAAFTYGREEPIPDMFRTLLKGLAGQGAKLDTMTLYLERHIHLDEHDHGPMGEAMLTELCGTDRAKWREAAEVAALALEARLALWTGVAAAITAARAGQPATRRRVSGARAKGRSPLRTPGGHATKV